MDYREVLEEAGFPPSAPKFSISDLAEMLKEKPAMIDAVVAKIKLDVDTLVVLGLTPAQISERLGLKAQRKARTPKVTTTTAPANGKKSAKAA